MGKNNKAKKAMKDLNKKPIKKLGSRKKDKKAIKRIKKKQKPVEEEEEEIEDEIALEDLEEVIPEEYKDLLMYDNDIENAPHDPFDIYPLPNTKEEHAAYINELIEKSHIILEVIDARNPEAYRHHQIEQRIGADENKTFLLLFNKTDLISDKHLKALKAHYEKKEFTIFTSACNRGKLEEFIADLRKLVQLHRKKKQEKDTFIQIGIIGYPNTGKEALITGLKLLGVEPPDHTRYIYLDQKMNYGVDSVPGTILADEIDEANENYKSIIPKAAKDIHTVTSPRVYVKDLLTKVSVKALKGVYSLKEEIKSVDDLLKALVRKYSLEKVEISHEDNSDKAALVIIKDAINGKLTYEVELS